MALHKPGWDALTMSCLVLILAHLPLALRGGYQAHPAIYEWLGLSRGGIQDWRLWQFATHPFLHGNWAHLLGNVAVIYFAGAAIVRILGNRWFLAIFGAGVLAGGIFHVLLHPSLMLLEPGVLTPSGPLVGASGGGMALLVALTVMAPDARVWPFPVSGKNFALGIMIAALLLYLMTPTLEIPVFSALGEQAVDAGMATVFRMGHACHFGGGLAGFLLMRWFLRSPVTLAELQRQRAKREGSMAA